MGFLVTLPIAIYWFGGLIVNKVAERQGFEPWLEFPLNTLSKRAPSATRPSLHSRSARVFPSLAHAEKIVANA
jgi:hypothetical protein